MLFHMCFLPDYLCKHFRKMVSDLLLHFDLFYLFLWKASKFKSPFLHDFNIVIGTFILFIIPAFLSNVKCFYLGLNFQLESLKDIFGFILNPLLFFVLQVLWFRKFLSILKKWLCLSKNFPIQDVHEVLLIFLLGNYLLFGLWSYFLVRYGKLAYVDVFGRGDWGDGGELDLFACGNIKVSLIQKRPVLLMEWL